MLLVHLTSDVECTPSPPLQADITTKHVHMEDVTALRLRRMLHWTPGSMADEASPAATLAHNDDDSDDQDEGNSGSNAGWQVRIARGAGGWGWGIVVVWGRSRVCCSPRQERMCQHGR